MLISSPVLMAQSISVNEDGADPDASAMLDVTSTNRGVLIPRMTLVQRTAIVLPAKGLIIYQTDNTEGFYVNLGIPALPNWQRLTTTSAIIEKITDADGDTRVETDAAGSDEDALRFVTRGTEQMIIDTLGNIGIGISAPSTDLHIERDTMLLKTPDLFDGSTFMMEGHRNNSGTYIGQIQFRNTDLLSSNNVYTAAQIESQNSGSTDDGDLRFYTTSDLALSLGMIIDINGNVGIGTSSPNYQLSLGTSLSNTKLALWDNGVGTSFGLGVQSSNFILHTNQTADRFTFYDDANLTNQLMTIRGTGNVGIGSNASPAERLDVEGSIQVDGEYTYEIPDTSFTGIPPSAFVSVRPETYELNAIGVIQYVSIGGAGGSAGWASAPIRIPNGATIVEMTYVYMDNDGSNNITCAIDRTGNTATSSTGFASFTSSGSSASYQTEVVTVNLTVDYENFYYQVYFQGFQGNNNIRMKNVIIKYTVNQAD